MVRVSNPAGEASVEYAIAIYATVTNFFHSWSDRWGALMTSVSNELQVDLAIMGVGPVLLLATWLRQDVEASDDAALRWSRNARVNRSALSRSKRAGYPSLLYAELGKSFA